MVGIAIRPRTAALYDPADNAWHYLSANEGLEYDGQGIYLAATCDARFQPVSADLSAIDALLGTSGFLKKTAADTWALDTATYLTTTDAATLYVGLSGAQTIAGAKTFSDPLTVDTSVADTGIVLTSSTNPRFTLRRAGVDRLRLDAVGSIGTIGGSANGLVIQANAGTSAGLSFASTGIATFTHNVIAPTYSVGSASGPKLTTDGTNLFCRNSADTAYIPFFCSTLRGTQVFFGGTSNTNVHMYGSATGVVELYNQAETGFDRICLGVASSSTSGPAIKRNGTAINFRLANDSADCPVTAALLTLSNGLVFSVLGKSVQYKSGTGARAGNATLVGGTVTITMTSATANTVVSVCRKTAGGTIGDLTYTVSAGASITINSSSAADTSVVSYHAVEVA